ncbi:iron uptake transporter deferrochelatase/peroxidase subunit [Nocardioides sp.]|jgi:deferrochelatase/peroxidase EfeB|uniref:iron uptake transporter deferrochelatase/peroxidase subunit n=1 Tax=Nocardioides sp. TaxID=35761 RepID=UPI002CF07F21|nr:iron uptake transporter deferrochelatase/peroxidase subunit [Nocardioides sp.]HVX53118.1 iron uptake transporter deferrochelatase/peroxidase subunit [Nocardioides sp.]
MSTSSTTAFSRRRLIQGAGVGAGAAVAVGAGFLGGRASADESGAPATDTGDLVDLTVAHEFYTGSHQAGIATEPQRHVVYMTFDLTTTSKQDLQVLLARWSAGIAQLMAGLPVGAVQPKGDAAVAADTGEAYNLSPSALTVTLGLGPGVFDDRFGLADKKPALLADLPKLPSDALQPALTGGDLSLQACADDPQVAYHAIRDLARMGRGVVDTRWTVLGFGRASAGKGQATPRNLLGFKDGTRNIKEPEDMDSFVWVKDSAGDVDWMTGGTYQVARKIEMNIEIWDADRVSDQERIFARTKAEGAPLTGTKEFDTPDFHRTSGGKPVIDPKSHVALAAHENNNGVRILRRSYNYTDGINQYGQLDAGLLFIAYMNDPAHFIQLQTKLGSSDLLNEYISHIGSAIFAVPPAPAKGHYIGEALFS